ncbi:MAG TPA: hypothetical protein PK967_20175 [Candidatus Hydrogenedentes bacterium]|nr:hypothetical protein [Candidatus Hydrogenedentota bacterium]
MHAAPPVNPAYAIEDLRCAPERLYLRIDLQIAVDALPEELAEFFTALARTGELRTAAREAGVSMVKAREFRLRIQSVFLEMGLGMYRGP